MIKKILSFFISISLITITFPLSLISAFSQDNEEIDNTSGYTNNYNKIHFYFDNEEYITINDEQELLDATSIIKTNHSNHVSSHNTNSVSNEIDNIYVTVEFESNFMKTDKFLNFFEERQNLNSRQKILEFRKKLNTYSDEYHNELIQKNIATLSILDYTSIQQIKYTPFVTANIIPDGSTFYSLQSLCQCENINNISIHTQAISDSDVSWDDALDAVNAYNIVSVGKYTGSGVRVGVLESGGVCDTSHVNLSNSKITIRDSSSAISDHATAVTSIIALIAPDAKLFVSQIVSQSEGISWFIDNYCDVVNCSFTTTTLKPAVAPIHKESEHIDLT